MKLLRFFPFARLQVWLLVLLALSIAAGIVVTGFSSQQTANTFVYYPIVTSLLVALCVLLVPGLWFIAKKAERKAGVLIMHAGLLLLLVAGAIVSLDNATWIVGIPTGSQTDRAFHESSWNIRVENLDGSSEIARFDHGVYYHQSSNGLVLRISKHAQDDGNTVCTFGIVHPDGAVSELAGILDAGQGLTRFEWEGVAVLLEAEYRLFGFSIVLENFTIQTYPGSSKAMDYVSSIRILGKETVHEIRMNKPFRYEGFVFYQHSWETLENGALASVLLVRYQPWFWAPYVASVILVAGGVISVVQLAASRRQRKRQITTVGAVVKPGKLAVFGLLLAMVLGTGVMVGSLAMYGSYLQTASHTPLEQLEYWPVDYQGRTMAFGLYASYHAKAIGMKTTDAFQIFGTSLGLLGKTGAVLLTNDDFLQLPLHQLPGNAHFLDKESGTGSTWSYWFELASSKLPFLLIASLGLLLSAAWIFFLKAAKLHAPPQLRANTVVLLIPIIMLASMLIERILLTGQPPVSSLQPGIVLAALLLLTYTLLRFDALSRLPWIVLAAILAVLALLFEPAGDRFAQIPPVLRSTFWLGVHVGTIITAYAASMAALVFAHVWLWRQRNTPAFVQDAGPQTLSMLLTVALTLLWAGTLLGGFWADQSWGRFWGWDPKENGALLIILWISAVLHMRSQALMANRMFMASTALVSLPLLFSWFGVNFLGKGMHSYGFSAGPVIFLVLGMIADFVFVAWLLHASVRHMRAQRALVPLNNRTVPVYMQKISPRCVELGFPVQADYGEATVQAYILKLRIFSWFEAVEREYLVKLSPGSTQPRYFIAFVDIHGNGWGSQLLAKAAQKAGWVQVLSLTPRPWTETDSLAPKIFVCSGSGMMLASCFAVAERDVVLNLDCSDQAVKTLMVDLKNLLLDLPTAVIVLSNPRMPLWKKKLLDTVLHVDRQVLAI